MPIGAILAYVGVEAPAGWLKCDGKLIPEEFKELRKLIANETTPDMTAMAAKNISLIYIIKSVDQDSVYGYAGG